MTKVIITFCNCERKQWYRALTVYALKVFQSGMLDRIYEPKRQETTRRKKTHNTVMKYTFHKNNFNDTKLMTIRWVEHVKCIEETRKVHDILFKKLKARIYSQDLGADGKITLNFI